MQDNIISTCRFCGTPIAGKAPANDTPFGLKADKQPQCPVCAGKWLSEGDGVTAGLLWNNEQ